MATQGEAARVGLRTLDDEEAVGEARRAAAALGYSLEAALEAARERSLPRTAAGTELQFMLELIEDR